MNLHKDQMDVCVTQEGQYTLKMNCYNVHENKQGSKSSYMSGEWVKWRNWSNNCWDPWTWALERHGFRMQQNDHEEMIPETKETIWRPIEFENDKWGNPKYEPRQN